MNVNELIELLKDYPSEMRLVVNGYEGGYNDITHVKQINIHLNVHPEWFYGAHDVTKDPSGLPVILIEGIRETEG
jgi:hypothetical protein